MELAKLTPEVLVACAQRGIPPRQVKAFEVTDVDVFITGPTGTIRVEISSLPAGMLAVARAQVAKPVPERAQSPPPTPPGGRRTQPRAAKTGRRSKAG
jgi:hypothetical protein